jgi:diguanylate cyclase (GGDEF)-like protein
MVGLSDKVISFLHFISSLVALPESASKEEQLRADALLLWPLLSGPLAGMILIPTAINSGSSLYLMAQIFTVLATMFSAALILVTRNVPFVAVWFTVWGCASLALDSVWNAHFLSPGLLLFAQMPVALCMMFPWRTCLRISFFLLLCLSVLFLASLSLGGTNESHLFIMACWASCLGSGLSTAAFGRSMTRLAFKLRTRRDELEQVAARDPLTGCLNRRAFDDRMHISDASIAETELLLCLIDLDRFKQINDLHGHGVGDDILTGVVSRIEDLKLAGIDLYRLGGDEFALVGAAAGVDLEQLVTSVANIAEDVFPTRAGDIDMTISVGLATGCLKQESSDRIYRSADIALFAAKENDTRRWKIYDRDLSDEHERHEAVVRRLYASLDSEDFDYVAQPQIDIVTEKIRGFEVLLRWTDRELGFVSPAEFVPIAERIRVIEEIDRRVFKVALREASHWLEDDMKLAFNISPRSLAAPDYIDFLREQLALTGLKPEQIELEITETSLVENWEFIQRRLAEVKALGIRLALDDFGTGYSSLNYLSRLPIDKLKIDRAFISRASDPVNRQVLFAVIKLARKLNLDLVAEGVESAAHLLFVSELRCPTVQGFYFSKPIPRTQIKTYIKETSERLAYG